MISLVGELDDINEEILRNKTKELIENYIKYHSFIREHLCITYSYKKESDCFCLIRRQCFKR